MKKPVKMNPNAQRLVQCLRDTATMRTQFPDWLLREIENAADLIESQARKLDAVQPMVDAGNNLRTVTNLAIRAAANKIPHAEAVHLNAAGDRWLDAVDAIRKDEES